MAQAAKPEAATTDKERAYEPHLTGTIVMISPDTFDFNEEAAVSNSFMQRMDLPKEEIIARAQAEWRGIVRKLEANGISVIQLPSRIDIPTPDAVFPNNWVTHHADGTLVLYPMRNESRRLERQPEKLVYELLKAGAPATRLVDLTHFEEEGFALEGTGSLILDRTNRYAYCIESPRADKTPFDAFCAAMGYRGVFFHAVDRKGDPIYHTNVMMSVGEQFAVICLDAIPNPEERDYVVAHLEHTGKLIIPISIEQMEKYGANILQLRNAEGNSVIIASQTAIDAYTPEQRDMLEEHGKLIGFDMPVIETIGGGSARCIMAEAIVA